MKYCAPLGLTLLFLASCGPVTPKAKPAAAAEKMPFDKITVEAADRLTINGERIRIANIIAPKAPPAAKCWAEAALARAAEERVAKFAAEFPVVSEIKRVGKDPDGAVAALVLIRGEDVGDLLVEDGLAAKWGDWDWCSGAPDPTDPRGPLLGWRYGLDRGERQLESKP